MSEGAPDVTFWCEAYPNQLKVVHLTGIEGISMPYRFEVALRVDDPNIDFTAIVDKDARLTIGAVREGREHPRYIRGIVSRFSLQWVDHETANPAQARTLYQAVLVPPIDRMTYRSNIRVFQDLPGRDIVSQVLSEHGLSSATHKPDFGGCSGSYAARDYCVQYRESDFDFVSRLLEEEGIAYHYQHAADCLTLAFSDSSRAFRPVPDPRIACSPVLAAGSAVITDVALGQALQTQRVELGDYYFKRARVSTSQSGRGTLREVYDFPAEHTDVQQDLGGSGQDNQVFGGKLAAVRREEHEAASEVGGGKSNCSRLVPGATFIIDGHACQRIDQQEFLLLRVTHSLEQADDTPGEGFVYHNQLVFIPAAQPYRPPRVTRKPVVSGSNTAVVVGPPGEEVFVDDHGRVMVRFHWDRTGKQSDTSCWVRVSQGWAGLGYGAVFIPRIGQEVLVDFIDGDPDRPVIVGRLYNGQQAVPGMAGGSYADYGGRTRMDPASAGVKANATRSLIRTSTVGGSGSNELRFEDGAGAEQVYLHAQRDLDIEVEENQTSLVKHDRLAMTQGSQLSWVLADHLIKVSGDSEIEAAGRLLLKCGSSAIELKPDEITIFANKLCTKSQGGARMVCNGPILSLNCTADAPAPSPPQIEAKRSSKPGGA